MVRRNRNNFGGNCRHFTHYKHFIKRDVSKQSTAFFTFLQQGFFSDNPYSLANNKLFTLSDIELLELEVSDLINDKGYAISKENLDDLVELLLKQGKLSPMQVKRVMDFSSSAYFYSGGMGNNALVAFSDYFYKAPIPAFLMDKESGTNLFYDPRFFINLLIALEVIRNSNDIRRLDFDDILKLRNNSYCKSFLSQYRRFSEICYRHFLENRFNTEEIQSAVFKRFSKKLHSVNRYRRGFFELLKNSVMFSTLPSPYNLVSVLPAFLIFGDYEKFISRKIGVEEIILRVVSRLSWIILEGDVSEVRSCNKLTLPTLTPTLPSFCNRPYKAKK
jgi:hypothetical protein